MKLPVKHIYFISLIFIILSFGLISCRSKKGITQEGLQKGVEIQIKKGNDYSSMDESSIVKEAMTWMGTPYAYGKCEKGKGTDCSGMVMSVYYEVLGIKLPRNASKQAEFCEKVSDKKVIPGDLVFFATGNDKRKVSHVGVMIDRVQFVHASGSKGVIISEMTTPYYSRTFLKFGRVPGIGNQK